MKLRGLYLVVAVLTGAGVVGACGRSSGGNCADYADCPGAGGEDGGGGVDAAADAVEVLDSTLAADAGDAQAAADGALPLPDTGPACTGKVCAGNCVAVDDPAYGCGATTCSPCSLPYATATCTNGACAVAQCSSGYAQCAGDDAGCATSLTTAAACGSCTTRCDAGLVCADDDAGALACLLQCPASAPTDCNGSCADLQTSNAHCGNCATPCAASTGESSAQCTGGVCQIACATGYHQCQTNGPCYPNSDGPTAPGDTCILSEEFGVFVATTGNDSAAGTRAAPLKTIQAGINAAQKASKRVYVCAGGYAEANTLATGVSIYGNLTCAGGVWATGTGRAVVTSPTSPAVSASSVTGVTVQSVEWDAPSEASTASASSYGMLAVGSTLSLVDVNLVAAAAGGGVAGTQGTAPVAPTAACTAASDGNAAPAAASGKPASAPAWTSKGYGPTSGTAGATGANGDNGSVSPVCEDYTTCQTETNGHCEAVYGGQVCASAAGTPGCGGPGGALGGFGTGGGASVALVAWDSTIDVSGGELWSSNAGNGGAGVAGGTAPSTWAYSNGTNGPPSSEEISNCLTSTCMQFDYRTVQSSGGNGGQGANGGNGGGGSGGDSYSYYRGAGATVTVDSTVSLKNGTAGAAGGGPLPGPAGYAAAANTQD